MKITKKADKYCIETTVNLPKNIMESYNVVETGFSPNPFNPVIIYELPSVNPNVQHLIDYILERE